MEIKPYYHEVKYYECDGMGITHHSNYIRFMEVSPITFFILDTILKLPYSIGISSQHFLSMLNIYLLVPFAGLNGGNVIVVAVQKTLSSYFPLSRCSHNRLALSYIYFCVLLPTYETPHFTLIIS